MSKALNGKLVTVFGGSGFIGRHVVQALARRGYRIRAAVRRPDLAEHLQPLGGVGQIMPVQANLRYRWSVDRAVEGADAVVNLVGILAASGKQTFEAVQAFGPRAIAEAARGAGLTAITHLSAIGADAGSDSVYARTKAAGEAAVLETLPDSVILRPSIVFGPEDEFFNRFAAMARISPALPLIGGGATRFQPVYVCDVAEAVARSVDGQLKPGATYELGGPEVKTFRECMELMLEVTQRQRLLLPIPFPVARLQAAVLEKLPGQLLTSDQVRLLRKDNVVSAAAEQAGLTLAGMGINPSSLAAVLPTYLDRFRERGQYDAHRVA
ncbi:NAD-dependent epimerase/dehydratase family protein [Microvirga tunisiensis]|uniref:NAD-dependent epimerase/dehydratase family protein n=2 Tax=Pannonibacter tanglangensis TaxID=2750084 RepID=A0ABW9ZPQ6_9HYPH|nr:MULTISPECIES: complex I NDUFA9 subunit family protein [unclassified Pannonibacter]NBN64964.1 NAD-dependent epimerase/dehydratase family protein [Pannonibacter sp. XCT-34]NBN79473.1 NAD-dependent epimerase/dehydratase family protein [Pannonibacter sp. XCT-53]